MSQQVESNIHRPLGGILDRNHTELGMISLHFLKYIDNGTLRGEVTGQSKMFKRGLMAECVFRAEKGYLDICLQGPGCGDDLPIYIL